MFALLMTLIGKLFFNLGEYPNNNRYFAALQLRICLSDSSTSGNINLWGNLTNETQNLIKIKLFEILFAEPNHFMKKHIADTLG